MRGWYCVRRTATDAADFSFNVRAHLSPLDVVCAANLLILSAEVIDLARNEDLALFMRFFFASSSSWERHSLSSEVRMLKTEYLRDW
jgi:hypothetical protein